MAISHDPLAQPCCRVLRMHYLSLESVAATRLAHRAVVRS